MEHCVCFTCPLITKKLLNRFFGGFHKQLGRFFYLNFNIHTIYYPWRERSSFDKNEVIIF
jgi:hypothetical protein